MLFECLYRYILFQSLFEEIIIFAHNSYAIHLINCLNTNVLGSEFTGDNHVFSDSEDEIHVTFDEEEELEKFDDNVNSAHCGCFMHLV